MNNDKKTIGTPAVILISAITFILSCIVVGDEFKIQDYIPDRFQDSQLKVSGTANLLGSDVNTAYQSTPGLSNYSRLYEQNSNEQDIRASALYKYNYETVPFFLNSSVSFNGTLDNYNSDYSSTSKYFTGDRYYSYSTSDYLEIENSISPSFDIGYYYHDDFFISSTLTSTYSYSYSPTYDDSAGYINTYFEYYDSVSITSSDTWSSTDTDSKLYYIDLNILPGWGHVYEGKYGSTAMYIVDELMKEGLIAQLPTQQQMIELSDMIYQMQNKHVIDSRLHNIEVIDKLIDYLYSENIITGKITSPTLILNDIWNYFPTYNRKFGYQFRLGAGYDYSHSNNEYDISENSKDLTTRYSQGTPETIDTVSLSSSHSKYETTTKRTSSETYITALANYYLPVNHKWQVDMGMAATYYLDSYLKYDHLSTYIEPSYSYSGYGYRIDYEDYFKLQFNSDIRYILNSRTDALLTLQAEYFNIKQDYTRTNISSTETEEEYNKSKSFSDFNFSLDLDLTYRISIPITLNVSTTYYYGPQLSSIKGTLYSDYDRSGYSIKTTLTYWII